MSRPRRYPYTDADAWRSAALSLAWDDPDRAGAVADMLELRARESEERGHRHIARTDRNAATLIRWAVAPAGAPFPDLEEVEL